MKLRKFFGLTSRSVLEQVRAELGPDAFILDNRPTPEGIEVTALAGDAIDGLLGEKTAGTRRRLAREAQDAGTDDGVPVLKDAVAAPAASPRGAPAVASSASPLVAPAAQPIAAPLAFAMDTLAQASAPAAGGSDRDFTSGRLMNEMAALRELVEQQLAQFAWNDSMRRSPQRSRSLRDLLQAGFSASYARALVAKLPDQLDATEAQQWIAQQVMAGVRCVPPDEDLVTRGGVYALTGATGVGKTTTAAKLAARCAVRFGAKSLALLTTDTYRVGAHDQLRIYARILGVGVHTVSTADDLRATLDSLSGRHLVLVDTLGMGQRDARVREHAILLAHPQVKRLLVLNATAQAETLDEVVAAYQPSVGQRGDSFAGAILSKLDEAVRLGDALDVVIRHQIPLHYLSTGQRVPEDLHVPNIPYLVHRALRSGGRHATRTLDDDEINLIAAGAPEHAHA